MSKIIGRNRERKILEGSFDTNKAEFVVVYGRRRVGKTFLIRNTFQEKKNANFFYVTGKKNSKKSDQLKHFMGEIGPAFLKQELHLAIPDTWDDAFKELTKYIQASKQEKIVLFLDEFPWMATRGSGLLESLDEFWNHRWSRDPRIKLVVCGSAAEWLLKRIIRDKGGFYNRVTRKIHLQPFSLGEVKEYLHYLKIKLSDTQIGHLYMVLGGIPFYLDQIPRGLSAAQAIEELAFGKESFLLTEFDHLYATLFSDGEQYVDLARAIALHPYGISAQELSRQLATVKSGEGLASRLDNLVNAGFVDRFKPYKHKVRGNFYKMVDEYSVFYFHWIEPIKNTLLEKSMRSGYWLSVQNSPAWHSWSGIAFEGLCYKHIAQISSALKLSPTALPSSWRYSPSKGSPDDGAQIDLLFDRDDGVITICEIKYTEELFAVDKACAQSLLRKMRVFKQKTKTKKDLFLAIVSANGLKKTVYSEEYVTAEVTMKDLFEPAS
jgi:predicted AAA+ superfamily ATPase